MRLLLRFGDLMLKGANRKTFISDLYHTVVFKLKNYAVKYEKLHDRIYIDIIEADFTNIENILHTIPGLYSYSVVYMMPIDNELIVTKAVELLNSYKEHKKFKIETKRADKTLPFTSTEFSVSISKLILKNLNKNLVVDVNNPDIILNIELRINIAFIYIGQILLMGGFPIGIAGTGLMLLSGGIDSPTASYLLNKQGMELSYIHFESTPFTPIEGVDKVISLTKELAKYSKRNKVNLYLVPFMSIHQALMTEISSSYFITIMRRIMIIIANGIAKMNKLKCLATGESLGQVASQTIESMQVINKVSDLVILRPLLTYDKIDIIKIARKINTFDISVLPFNDCCSIYIPTNPIIKPTINECLIQEAKFDFSSLVSEAMSRTIKLVITPTYDLKLSDYGFCVGDYLKSLHD